MKIGCENHNIEDWRNFNDEEIASMDSKALQWWKKYKEAIFIIVDRGKNVK